MGFFMHRPGGKSIRAGDVALMGWYTFLKAKHRIPRLSKSVLSEKSWYGRKDEKTTDGGRPVLDYPIYNCLACNFGALKRAFSS